MSSINLNPNDVNYLSSELLFNQLKENQESLTLSTGVVAGNSAPSILLDGSSRCSLTGQLVVTNAATISANMKIANLPEKLTPSKDCSFPVAVLRGATAVTNYLNISGTTLSVIGVNITNAGQNYTSIPTYSTSGAGTGLAGTVSMGAYSATVQTDATNAGGSYNIADTITLTGGAVVTVVETQLHAAVISNGGSGGADGPVVLTGTSGAGTKYQIQGTIAGGTLTSVGLITVTGTYTSNPIANDPVTGGGLTGAILTVRMGVKTVNVTTASSYTALPSNPVAQTASSGVGLGATFNLKYKVVGFSITNPGEGYTTSSTFAFAGGSPTTPATATMTLENTGSLLLVNAPTANDVVCLDTCKFLVNSYS